ncbi:hypothetical protein [Thalassovita sp.]|uniref:hypothetical protein n=1 Tax=Thalassovita sp. TaxID=1979401 RepID=UPI002AB2F1DA|nr:hypothetical protein [Thalassovita sp.]
MGRYALAAALAVVLALFAALWWLSARNDALTAEVAALRVSVASAQHALEQAETAAAVHRAYLARAEADAERWRAVQNDLQSMEGRDAPLSPLLRTTAQRLFARP